MLIIILSTLYNYIFSNEIILEKLFVDNNISYYYGITKIFEKNNKNNSVSLNISVTVIFLSLQIFKKSRTPSAFSRISLLNPFLKKENEGFMS